MAGEIESLEELGLSANEAKLYLLLVTNGQMKANELAVKSGMQRRTVYDTLAQLEKKGLAGKAEVQGVQTFSPSPPSSLLSLLDEKRDSVEKILPSLSKSFESEERAGATVLYGAAGIKTILEDILHLRADFCVYYGQLQIFESLPKFFPLFNEKRKGLGIKSRYILLDLPKVRERAKKIPLAEFRFIDPSAISAGVWWTYADRLVLFILQKEPTTILIKNKELAKTFQETFNSIFESKAQVYRGLEGIKALLERTLEYNETLFIGGRGSAPSDIPEYFRERYTPEALRRGHIWRTVAYNAVLKTPAVKLPFHRIRLLTHQSPIDPTVFWIFGDCVANVVWLKEPVAFVLENKGVAHAYCKYFELLWGTSKPI
jgi:predicted DNA-binding transcriptional regulator